MVAINSLSRTGNALKRNPILFAAGFLVALEAGIVAAAFQVPFAGFFLGLLVGAVFLFVEPFIAGGLLGMGREAFDGETDFDRFLEAGKAFYLRLLGARILSILALVVYAVAVTIALIVLVLVVGIGGEAVTAEAGAEAMDALGLIGMLGFLAFFLCAILLYYVVGLFVQFHPAAIVMEEQGLIDSIGRSVEIVRENLLTALGYSAIVWLLAILIGGIPTAYISVTGTLSELALMTDAETGLGITAVNLLVFFGMFVAIHTFLQPFLRLYHLAVFDGMAD